MASSVGPPIISDSRRDAEKYHKLLFAIETATDTINSLEKQGRASIDEVLASLLPDLAEALDAAQAFVAIYRGEKGQRGQSFELVSIYPRRRNSRRLLPWSRALEKVLSSRRARVIEPFEDEPKKLIPGLELFGATTAILMRMQIGNQSRIVGVCNRSSAGMEPFLGTDRRALESIVELIAIGMRVGEQRTQELENIQKISTAINAKLNPDELLPLIAQKAAEVFSVPTTSLMLWDKKQENLIIKASHGLSQEYVKRQRISRKSLEAALSSSGNKRAIVTADLQKRPFGKPALIISERLRSALTAQLQVSGEMIGLLNIYSQDSARIFTSGELELAEIFANHAAMAINNARLYDEIRKTKDYLLTSQSVAWLGLYAADLQHTIHQKAFSLENIASGLREWVQRLNLPPEDIEDVLGTLDGLDSLSNNIRAVRITNQMLELPGDAGTWTYIEIDGEIQTICERLLQAYPDVEKEIVLNCPGVKVMIAPEGLQVAMEKLVHNAAKAMSGRGRIKICTEKSGRMVHIRVIDNGPGIPEESLPYFLTRAVPRKHKGEGTGTGVLIARFVALSHGGDLELVNTTSNGTELRMMLPSVEK